MGDVVSSEGGRERKKERERSAFSHIPTHAHIHTISERGGERERDRVAHRDGKPAKETNVGLKLQDHRVHLWWFSFTSS
jgi:hypothetical protein